MYSKTLKFENLENIRLLVTISLDIVTIILKEKDENLILNNVLTRKFKIKDIESFNFEDIIDKVMKQYIHKKSVEEHVTNYLKDESINTIVLPNIEVLNNN